VTRHTTHVEEKARRLPVIDSADIVVLGGGSAGLSAAVSAARLGADVLLIERYGFLGGVATAAMVTSFCGLYLDRTYDACRIVRGFADDLLSLIDAQGGLAPPRRVKPGAVSQAFDVTAYKFAADDLVDDAGVRLRLHSFGVAALLDPDDDSRIGHIVVESKSGRGAIAGKVFIDASGDGDLASVSGCTFEIGDEHGFMQYPTTMFRMRNVEDVLTAGIRKTIGSKVADAIASGEYDLPRKYVSVSPQPFSTEWRANATQVRGERDEAIDGTDVLQLSRAETEGRRQVREFHRFLKNRVDGFANSSILDTAPQIGIRETRRILGERELDAEHVAEGKTCHDAIGLGCWPFETHRNGTVDWRAVGGRGYYDIPLGMMVPAKGPINLLVAGRCASASPEALASVRVMGSCMVMGQAAGTLAALAVQETSTFLEIETPLLRQTLENNGVCFLPDSGLLVTSTQA
jgi:hypothetical protein